MRRREENEGERKVRATYNITCGVACIRKSSFFFTKKIDIEFINRSVVILTYVHAYACVRDRARTCT